MHKFGGIAINIYTHENKMMIFPFEIAKVSEFVSMGWLRLEKTVIADKQNNKHRPGLIDEYSTSLISLFTN